MEQREATRMVLRLARGSVAPGLVKELCASSAEGARSIVRALAEACATRTEAELAALVDEVAVWHLDKVIRRHYADKLDDAYRLAQEHEARTYGEGGVASSFSYGELDARSFGRVWRCVRQVLPPPQRAEGGATMVDVGSGRGVTPVMAALVDPAIFANGIEVVESLHRVAVEALDKVAADRPEVSERVMLIRGDAAGDTRWASEADVVFLNWTCFDNYLVGDLSATVEDHMRPGAVLVTFATAIQSIRFLVTHKLHLKATAWGDATCFVHRKLTDDEARLRLGSNGLTTKFDADQAVATYAAEPSDTMDSMENLASEMNDDDLDDDDDDASTSGSDTVPLHHGPRDDNDDDDDGEDWAAEAREDLLKPNDFEIELPPASSPAKKYGAMSSPFGHALRRRKSLKTTTSPPSGATRTVSPPQMDHHAGGSSNDDDDYDYDNCPSDDDDSAGQTSAVALSSSDDEDEENTTTAGDDDDALAPVCQFFATGLDLTPAAADDGSFQEPTPSPSEGVPSSPLDAALRRRKQHRESPPPHILEEEENEEEEEGEGEGEESNQDEAAAPVNATPTKIKNKHITAIQFLSTDVPLANFGECDSPHDTALLRRKRRGSASPSTPDENP